VEQLRPTVLVVDDDAAITQLLEELLVDEGYAVSILKDTHIEAIQETVAQQRSDCVLLDGGDRDGYGESWDSAAMLAGQIPPVPVVMFTAHREAAQEALANTSLRSQAARFSGVLLKPFELSELTKVIEESVARSRKFELVTISRLAPRLHRPAEREVPDGEGEAGAEAAAADLACAG
jgi:CheY-like chemotaxis protein